MKFKLIITDAAHFFWKNLNQIAILCLPWLFAGALVEYLIVANQEAFGDAPIYFASWAFNLLVYPIYTAALIHMMAQQAKGIRPGNRELFTLALQSWQSLLLLHLLVSLLALFGLMLLVLPGIWVIVRFSFSEFFLVLEDLNPLVAIQKSIQATKPYIWTIFLLILIFLFPVAGVSFVLGRLIEDTPQAEAIMAIAGTLASFYMLFVDVLIFRVFMSALKEGPEDPQKTMPDA
jgi:nitrate reductase NapE component